MKALWLWAVTTSFGGGAGEDYSINVKTGARNVAAGEEDG